MAQRSTPTPGLNPPQFVKENDPEHSFSTNAPDVYVPAQPISGKRRRWSGTGKLLVGGFVLLTGLSFFLSIILVGFILFNSEIIFPGVRVMGIDVGSLTRDEAATVLAQEWQQQALLISYEESVWPVGVTDLGFVLDVSTTVEEAYKQGRTLASWREMVVNGGSVKPVWSWDANQAQSFLLSFSDEVSRSPVNAGLQIQNGEVIETSPVDGRVLDIEGTLARLQENPAQIMVDGRLPLSMERVAPEVSDVSWIAEEARRLLSNTVAVHAYDPIRDESLEWTIPPSQWGNWLTLQTIDGGFEWALDENTALESASTWLPAVGDERYFDAGQVIADILETVTAQESVVKARIFHHPRKHIVQAGETLSSIGWTYGIPYPWIQEANPGSDILRAGDEITIPSQDEMLPLPVVENKRVVVSLSEQRTRVYENGALKWDWPASTGIDSSPTAPGIFQVQSHESNAYASNWDLWMPNFMGIYRPVPTSDFMNGFHGFPTRNGSSLLWTGDLGHQVTYGCVLLSSENAEQLYEWAGDGVVVEVKP